MEAPSSTVPVPAPGPGPSNTDADTSFFTYVREFVSGTATLLQEAPVAVASEAAGLVQEVPIVGIVCKMFLSLEQLVETAKSNKDDLATLLELCDVVIEGLLDKRADRSGLFKGFVALEKCVERAKEVTKRCNGRVKVFILARKICKDIASVRSDLLGFCTANNLALSHDTNIRVEKMENNIIGELKTMQKDNDAMEKEVALITKEREDLRKKIEAGEKSSLNLEAELRSSKDALGAMEAELQAHVGSVSDQEEELVISQKKLQDVKKDVAFKTKELENRKQVSLDLEAALLDSKEDLAALKAELEEQRRVNDLASKVKVPPGAPRIRDWYTERKAIVHQACNRLGIGRTTDDASEEPRMVGLAGPSGSGKSTVASMIVARVDVRASFHKGVLWLQVGQGSTGHLPELMLRLAGMVYEIVMSKACRPPREKVLEEDLEDGAAYIREVVDERSRRFLVVADDVWDVEVLRELKSAGLWVVYTTRQEDVLPEPPLRLDQLLKEEAELVLRRAADLDDDARLPEAAYELMRRCEFGVLHLAFIGRWSDVRGRSESRAWQRLLISIEEARKGSRGEKLISWRAAMLRAGLEELACDNPNNKELYLSLAVVPKGLVFPSEVAAVLLYGNDFSAGDLKAADEVVATLERLSILTIRRGGRYSVHDEHADFVQECFARYEGTLDKVLPWWRAYISSVGALLTFSSIWLVKIWEVLGQFEGQEVPSRPYDVTLDALDLSDDRLPTALRKVASFQRLREDWLDAYRKNFQLLTIEEEKLGGDHLDVASTLYNLGRCAYKAGKVKEAEGFYRRALGIREEKLGGDHPDVVSTLRNLGLCAFNAGKLKEAEDIYRRALGIREKLGGDHPDVVSTLHRLGMCTCMTGKVKEAEAFHRRALAIREKLGADDPDMAGTLHELGVCAYKAGRVKEAEAFHRRALEIREEKLGGDHPDVARSLHSLGVCAYKAGRAKDAKEFYRRALGIQEEKLGGHHPDVALTRRDLHSLTHAWNVVFTTVVAMFAAVGCILVF